MEWSTVPFSQLGVVATLTSGFAYFLRYQAGLLDRSETRVKMLEQRLETLDRRLARSIAGEWLCQENVATLRRALIDAGVDVPELRMIHAALDEDDQGNPSPRRRRSDYATDERTRSPDP